MLKLLVLINLIAVSQCVVPECALNCIKFKTSDLCLENCCCGFCNFTFENVSLGLCFYSDDSSVCQSDSGIQTQWTSSTNTDKCKSIHEMVNFSLIIFISVGFVVLLIICILVSLRNKIQRCCSSYRYHNDYQNIN